MLVILPILTRLLCVSIQKIIKLVKTSDILQNLEVKIRDVKFRTMIQNTIQIDQKLRWRFYKVSTHNSYCITL